MSPLDAAMLAVFRAGDRIVKIWPTAPNWTGVTFEHAGDDEIETGGEDPMLVEFSLRLAARIGALVREAERQR